MSIMQYTACGKGSDVHCSTVHCHHTHMYKTHKWSCTHLQKSTSDKQVSHHAPFEKKFSLSIHRELPLNWQPHPWNWISQKSSRNTQSTKTVFNSSAIADKFARCRVSPLWLTDVNKLVHHTENVVVKELNLWTLTKSNLSMWET